MPDPEAQVLDDELRATLAEHDRSWHKLDMRALFRMWDPEEKVPVYIGGEYSAPVVGRGDLGRHWGRLGGRIISAEVHSTLVHTKLITAQLALIVYLSEWEFETADSNLHHVGQDWVTAVLRRSNTGWRFVHQAESGTFNAHAADAGAEGARAEADGD